MAAALEQLSPRAYGTGTGSAANTFSSTPATSSVIMNHHSQWQSSANPLVSSMADNQSNSYTLACENSTAINSARTRIYYAYGITSSGTFTTTVTWNSGSDMVSYSTEWSGLETGSDPFDSGSLVTATATATSTDANVTSNTFAQADTLVIAQAMVGISSDTNVNFGAAATTGYTNVAVEQNWSGGSSISIDYKSVSATTAQSANWSHDDCSSPGNGWACHVMGFVVVAAGGGGLGIPIAYHHYRTMHGA